MTYSVHTYNKNTYLHNLEPQLSITSVALNTTNYTELYIQFIPWKFINIDYLTPPIYTGCSPLSNLSYRSLDTPVTFQCIKDYSFSKC